MNPPNILLIMTDQQRFDSLGCYGATFAHTPNLDALAADGIRFEYCYVNNTICTPSRASLMTGLTLPEHQVHQLYGRLDDTFTLFPKHLQDLGYYTALVGKLHVSDYHHEAIFRHPNDGFDDYFWCHDPTLALDSPFNAYALWLAERDPAYLEKLRQDGWQVPAPADLHMTTWAAEQTIDVIRQRPADKPFFCMMSVFDPHNPYHDCPEPYLRKVDLNRIPSPQAADEPVDSLPEAIRREHEGSYMGPFTGYSQEDIIAMRRGYHGSVALIDEQVGRVLAELEAQAIAEDTLVVFVSDHGDMLGDHQLLVKGAFFYDPCTRVPLLIRWPQKLQSGQVRSDLSQPHDLAATLLRAAGMPREQLHHLMPDAHDLLEEKDQRQWAICHYPNTGICVQRTYFDPPIHAAMVRDQHYKLNVFGTDTETPEYQLFDMRQDPQELTNRASDPELQAVKNHLQNILNAHQIPTTTHEVCS